MINLKDWISYKLILVLCIWLIICIMVTSMLGSLGATTADKNMEERYHNGLVTEQEYSNWHNIVIPILPFVFVTMEIIAIFIVAIPIYIIVIPLYKLYKEEKKV